ncbi:MAG: phage tail tube protein [Xanthomonadaceae bacterium]|nr:phage tail tube protein [Xanthomonadaceae bacterium]
MAAAKRLGKATIKIGGVTLETMPGATLDPGGTSRETQVGANEVLGWTEKPKQSRLECTVSIRAGVSIADLQRADVSALFAGDTGQVWSIGKAWCIEPPMVDSGAGTARLIYEGTPAEEVG